MKKLLSMFLVALMVIAMFPVAVSQDVTAVESERIAYLDSTTTITEGEVGNSNKPFKTLVDAYNALCPEGGKIVLVAPYDVSDSITGLAHHYGVITITAYNKSTDYINFTKSEGTFKCAGPVTFKDIRLVAGIKFYILGNYNHITMDTGVSCEKTLGTSLDGKNSASNIAILGGTFTSCAHADTKVTIRSGNYCLCRYSKWHLSDIL